MAVPGRLVHLAATVTLASSASAAAVIPATGGPALGDLLLVACQMPSGSRTFSISGGGAAGWTSLGSIAQTGCTAQLWWKLCQAADLGATITVTPSSASIRQVLLLGSVSGVDPTNPFGSPAAVSSVNSSSSTAKTPTAVTSVATFSREVDVVFDSRSALTPQTASWTPPASMTLAGAAYTTAGSGASSGAWGDSTAGVSGTIGGQAWTADQAALGAAWCLGIHGDPAIPNPATGISSATAFGTPTMVPGNINLSAAGAAPSTAVGAPSIAPGTVTIPATGGPSTTTFGAPTAAPGTLTVQAPGIAPGAAPGQPLIVPGTVALSASGIPPSAAIGSPTIGDPPPDDITITIGSPRGRWKVGPAWT